ncbi:MAG: ankyrin repeat domain-containing protein [Candidatus Electrothrix sp. ATG2]|nr:ankyrin repeat domain-containing protein [Candidatus Electrothrix sp. ATG2]
MSTDCLFPAEGGEAEVKINSIGCDDDTPLHVLIWRNDTEGALLLIENNAPINAIGDMGETPLHVAIRQNNFKIIKVLLNTGAKTDIVSEFGQTANEVACQNNINLSDFVALN